ncbi:pyridoxamine 5'-phosphate oxidase family protein [Solirubrobacter phytolaccae]|uniref:Pyridoxamine 5'-phosphate oxidase family protein n=1 Tax=Solirubrobacter phytolaccae TaxID=1404360 RepID=A0A9X3NEZ4_9ACTN|nr:pyridoxamine 5'-phosphate oxidase family protein [Solirubrobacter phytolaccae]MDA0183735.1 pyridoxamine 5'-phosphate oxidase family protein [Solirubrobacter phytolaccae]
MHRLSELPDWAAELLETTPVGHLALLDADGHPRVQPVTFARLATTLVSAVDGKPKRSGTPARVERLQANPRATLTVDHYDDDWTRLAWVQILATATIGPLHDEARAALRARYPQYETTPLTGPLITLSPLRILAWRASG